MVAWQPTSTDDTVGGPDSVNPLLTADGRCAIGPKWPTREGYGVDGSPSVVASGSGLAGGRSTSRLHERGGLESRRMTLEWDTAPADEIELVRKAVQVCAGGGGATRFRFPGEAGGSVATARRVRIVPGTFSVTRPREMGGLFVRMSVAIEMV